MGVELQGPGTVNVQAQFTAGGDFLSGTALLAAALNSWLQTYENPDSDGNTISLEDYQNVVSAGGTSSTAANINAETGAVSILPTTTIEATYLWTFDVSIDQNTTIDSDDLNDILYTAFNDLLNGVDPSSNVQNVVTQSFTDQDGNVTQIGSPITPNPAPNLINSVENFFSSIASGSLTIIYLIAGIIILVLIISIYGETRRVAG
jgi:hypothetical protein